jgi:acyl-coenzyme A thioesterase PaaI-like protein
MTGALARDPDFAARVAASFQRQTLMSTLGATLERVEPEEVEIALVQSPGILQQHGFIHGGAITAIADSAAGYAR